MCSRKNCCSGIFMTLIIMILFPVSSMCAEEKETSEILEQAHRNIEKYRKGDATITFKTEEGESVKDTEVVIEQVGQDFLFGNIIFPVVGVLGKFEDIDVYRPELFKQRFKDVFNMAIFPFYWSSYERIPGREKWDRIVPILDWCKVNGVTPKGHPLAWVEGGGTPRWLYDLPVAVTEEMLKGRIIRNTKGFKGQIDIWDVVNEPTHTISWSSVMKEPYGVRYTSIPVNEIADWVEKCFRWAHEGNPEAELVINDYEQIVSNFIPDTRERFYKLIEELKKRGTPLHGTGLQAHEPRSE
ncbi:MAG: endo-1,4-beta-xylanase, partial [Planctomycetota bacterium]